MLQVKESGNQARQRRRATGVGRKEPGPFPLKDLPVDQGGKFHQLVAHVDHLDQAGAQEIVLFRERLSRLHITACRRVTTLSMMLDNTTTICRYTGGGFR